MSINTVSNQQINGNPAVSGSAQSKGSAEPTSEAGMFQLTQNANQGVRGITVSQLAEVANQLGLTDAQRFELIQFVNQRVNGHELTPGKA